MKLSFVAVGRHDLSSRRSRFRLNEERHVAPQLSINLKLNQSSCARIGRIFSLTICWPFPSELMDFLIEQRNADALILLSRPCCFI